MEPTTLNPSPTPDAPLYILCLYIAGEDPKSVRALRELTTLCEMRLQGRYELEVIDIYEQPERMEEDQVFAIPTLLKRHPPPLSIDRRFIRYREVTQLLGSLLTP